MNFKNKNWLIKFTALILALFFFSAGLTIINEHRGSRNIFINISKRLIAELGAFFVNRIYDPGYKGGDRVNFAPEMALKLEDLFNNSNRNDNFLLFLEDELDADVIKYNNLFNSGYALNFDYQPFNSKKLIKLREKYQLKKITDEFNTEIERIIYLRDWVKNRWEYGVPKNIDYNFNALNILERAAKGESFFCSEYSTVFLQCTLAIGLQARYLTLFKGHVVAEVWSNEFSKWIVMDVTNNLHYVRDGIPLNSLELHEAWESDDWDSISALEGNDAKVVDKERLKFLISFYHEFCVRMRNDWFSNKYPHWHPKANSIMNALEWKDKYTANNILVARETVNKQELYFPLNITSLAVIREKSRKGHIQLTLNTFTPNFSHFIIQIDEDQPVKQKNHELIWNVHQGQNRLKCQAVNSLGVKGPASEVIFKLNIRQGFKWPKSY